MESLSLASTIQPLSETVSQNQKELGIQFSEEVPGSSPNTTKVGGKSPQPLMLNPRPVNQNLHFDKIPGDTSAYSSLIGKQEF